MNNKTETSLVDVPVHMLAGALCEVLLGGGMTWLVEEGAPCLYVIGWRAFAGLDTFQGLRPLPASP